MRGREDPTYGRDGFVIDFIMEIANLDLGNGKVQVFPSMRTEGVLFCFVISLGVENM